MQSIFIGVDGGGTKTKTLVENESGEVLGQALTGPANIRTCSEQAYQSVLAGVEQALAQAGIQLADNQYQFHAGLALAGTEDPRACQQFLAKPFSFHTIKLASDAYAACLGVHQRNDGAIIIIGTGVVGVQIYQGQAAKVGGWGFPQSDSGGGAWLGMEAVRLTFKWIDGRVSKTPLLEAIFAHFNQDVEQMVSWCTEARPAQFGTLAPYVVDHLQQEDAHAVQLIKNAANEIDLVALAMNKQLPAGVMPLPCCLMSGLAPFVGPFVSDELKARLVPRRASAEQGAVYLIRDFVEEGGAGTITRDTIECVQFSASNDLGA